MNYRFWKTNSTYSMYVKKNISYFSALWIFIHISLSIEGILWASRACFAILSSRSCTFAAVASNGQSIPISLHLNDTMVFSPAGYLVNYLFIYFCTFQKVRRMLRDILLKRFILWDISRFTGLLLIFYHLSDASCLNNLSWIFYRFQISIKTGILFHNQGKRVITLAIRSQD